MQTHIYFLLFKPFQEAEEPTNVLSIGVKKITKIDTFSTCSNLPT